jgi:hypothetical protein
MEAIMSDVCRRDALISGLYALPIGGLGGLWLAQQAAAGQVAQEPAARTTQNVNAAGEVLASLDPVMAGCLLLMGKTETDVCRFATEKISDEKVKKFANDEIDEQENLRKKLEGLGYQCPAAPISRGELTNPNRGGRQIAVGRTQLPPGYADMMALGQEVSDQCLATAKSELGKLSGKEFDRHFVGCQLGSHYAQFDHCVVFRKHASRDLAGILDAGRQNIENGIAQCKKLMEQLA